MQYEVIGDKNKIDFGATGVAEVLQNVRTIISTPIYSVPLDRSLGIDFSMLDQPTPASQAKISAALYTVLRKYEPRAIVKKIDFVQSVDEIMNGRLLPRVIVEVDL
jgi:phage baseplate assembly protein W